MGAFSLPAMEPESSTPTEAAAAATATPMYVNYLDVKLSCIANLPTDWFDGAEDAPGYPSHPFHYEVAIISDLTPPPPPPPPAAQSRIGDMEAALQAMSNEDVTAESTSPADEAAPASATAGNSVTSNASFASAPHRRRGDAGKSTSSTGNLNSNNDTSNNNTNTNNKSAEKPPRLTSSSHKRVPALPSRVDDVTHTDPLPTSAESGGASEAPRYVFTLGRLLQPLPDYLRYIETAVPLPVAGMEEVRAMEDVPAPVDLGEATALLESGSLRPAAMHSGGSASGSESGWPPALGANDGRAPPQTSPLPHPSRRSSSAGKATCAAGSAIRDPAAPVLLWLTAPALPEGAAAAAATATTAATTPTASATATAAASAAVRAESGMAHIGSANMGSHRKRGGGVAAKKLAQASPSTSSHASSSNTTAGQDQRRAAKDPSHTHNNATLASDGLSGDGHTPWLNGTPALPDKHVNPPCVLRIPLSSEHEAELEARLRRGTPLHLRLRRRLRPNAPAEWGEDLNAAFYEADIRVDLSAWTEAGSTVVCQHAPLQPSAVWERGTSAAISPAHPPPPAATMNAAAGNNNNNHHHHHNHGGASGAQSHAAGHHSRGAVGTAGGNCNRNSNSGNAGNYGESARDRVGGNTAAEAHDRAKKRAAARRSKTMIPHTLYEEPDYAAPHPYDAHGSVAVVSLSLMRTLTPLVSDGVRPDLSPAQLIPTRTHMENNSHTNRDSSIHEGEGEVTAAASAAVRQSLREMAQELMQVLCDEEDDEASLPAGGRGGQEDRAAARAHRFMHVLHARGTLHRFHQALTAPVVNLVRAQFTHRDTLTTAELSALTNELYVYLLDAVHGVLPEVMHNDGKRGAERRASSHHPSGTISPPLSTRNNDSNGNDYNNNNNNNNNDNDNDNYYVDDEDEVDEDAESERWRQRAEEAEVAGECDLASRYHYARLALDDDDTTSASQHTASPATHAHRWTRAAESFLRAGDVWRAESCFRDAIARQPRSARALTHYGALLMCQGRLSEAAVFVHGAADVTVSRVLSSASSAASSMFHRTPSPHRRRLAWGWVTVWSRLRAERAPVAGGERGRWAREYRHARHRALAAAPDPVHVHIPVSVSAPSTHTTSLMRPCAAADVDAERTASTGLFAELARDALDLGLDALATVCLSWCDSSSHAAVEVMYAHLLHGAGQHEEALTRARALLAHMRRSRRAAPVRRGGGEERNGEEKEDGHACEEEGESETEESGGAEKTHVHSNREGAAHTGNDDDDDADDDDKADDDTDEEDGDGDGDYTVARQYTDMMRDELRVLCADCLWALGRLDAAVSMYKRALCRRKQHLPRWAHGLLPLSSGADRVPDAAARLPPPRRAAAHRRFAAAYLRLGNALLQRGTFHDALGVFTLTIQFWPSAALPWLGAGIAYLRIAASPRPAAHTALAHAEMCLSESNMRNPLNPRSWAYLILVALRTRRPVAEVQELLREVEVHQLREPALWAELGREMLFASSDPVLAEVCLRRALDATRDTPVSPSGRALMTVTQYHLAHALRRQRRWPEAVEVLWAVVRRGENAVLRGRAEEELRELGEVVVE